MNNQTYHHAPPITINEAVGQSEAFLTFWERLSKVAPINRPVLLIGERGTGKELAALRLHHLSKRWQGPLVALNCSALTPSLIGAELFGYEKGAFTGAAARHIGRFETADNGTLFLDEIGNIPMEVQEKILRVVEYETFERVGGSKSVEVNVRIIAATNADLPQMAAEGRFKPDLLDRLSFEVLFLPPLRVRKGDIRLLADHFARQMAIELGLDEMPHFSDQAIATLKQYSWPGNVRELKNVVERAVYRTRGKFINTIEIDPFCSPYNKKPDIDVPTNCATSIKAETFIPNHFFTMPFKTAVETLEIALLSKALASCKHNQKKTARQLGLTYDQLRGLLRKYKGKLK
ncbi:phage shock protein operon transcriptional activator [Desulfococcaceae bacterium HSG9]|nr:phage shock protein operon transcriptional activator [Desulfococcaceae bacterium HSG9]